VVRDVMTEILLRNPAAKPAFVAGNQAAIPVIAAAEWNR
jgi:hypothetical protein